MKNPFTIILLMGGTIGDLLMKDEDKQDKISIFLYNIYDSVLLETKDKGEAAFRTNLKNKIDEVLSDKKNSRIEKFTKDKKLKPFYDLEIEKKVNRYNIDKENFKNAEYTSQMKKTVEEQEKIEKIITEEYNYAKINENKDKFKGYFNKYNDLKKFKENYEKLKDKVFNDNKKEINNKELIKLVIKPVELKKFEEEYKYLEKLRILTIKYENISKLKFIQNDKDEEKHKTLCNNLGVDYDNFIKVYENLKTVDEFKKNNSFKYNNIFQLYENKYILELSSTKTEINEKLNNYYLEAEIQSTGENDFIEFYNKKEDIKEYKDKYPIWFEDCFKKVLKNYQIFDMKKKIDKEFGKAKNENNTKEFIKYYDSLVNIKKYAEKFKEEYPLWKMSVDIVKTIFF